MKKFYLLLFACILAISAFADSIFYDGFEFSNHDMEVPIGWTSNDQSWLCGYLEKDHNRKPHTDNWYAFTNSNDSWMFTEVFMVGQLKYRFSCWVISDGSFTLEFWAGNGTSVNLMTTKMFSVEINNENYEKISEYIESLSVDYKYIGIHAIASEGAHHLTIDDINVDMVAKYDMEIDPYIADTVIYPGTQFFYSFTVKNTGYQSMNLIRSISTDYFTDVIFTADGVTCSYFPIQPDQIVHCTCTGTLLPSVTSGSGQCWVDIILSADCDCITRMTTLWVTPIFETIDENQAEVKLYPNPVHDFLNIVSEKEIKTCQIIDLQGKILVINNLSESNNIDLRTLPEGSYMLKIQFGDGEIAHKKILKK